MLAPKTTSSGSAGEKIRHGDPRAGKHGIGTLAGGKESVGVGIAAAQIIRDCVDHPLRNLGSTGTVKINDRVAIERFATEKEIGSGPSLDRVNR